PNLYFSISHTTRKIRKGEKEGKDYYFIDVKTFKKMIEKKQLAEWARVHNNYYGTSKKEINTNISKGFDILLDIDVQGASQIKKNYPESIHIFIMPPSFEELEKRLRGRGDLEESNIKIRLNNAKKEIEKWFKYDYVIINENLKDSVNSMLSILKSFKLKKEAQKEKIKSIILDFKRR
ncbi:MAG: guanylate kinase, partial [Thermoanaerobaculia bacterium]